MDVALVIPSGNCDLKALLASICYILSLVTKFAIIKF